MLPSWITRLALALALAVLPLQGLAATVRVILCEPQHAAADHAAGAHSHAQAGSHAHGHHGHASAEASHGHHAGHGDGADTSSGQHESHFCCDLAGAGALPVFAKSIAEIQFTPLAAAAEASRYSTYLKLLQRPPLA